MVVYVAGPYRGKNAWEVEQNIRLAEGVGFRVAQMGAMPLIPHTNTRFFSGTLTSQFWIDGALELLRRCNAVVLCWGWGSSEGSVGEYDEALRLGIPIFETNSEAGWNAFRCWLEKPDP